MCPFCVKNGMVKILFKNKKAYLIQVLDRNGQVVPGCYFIIPKIHVESVLDLPDDWHRYYKDLLRRALELGLVPDHNGTYNEGRRAGQRVPHVHIWLVSRDEGENEPSYELGLVGMRDKLNQKK